ncbi:hypothetical protein AB0M20_13455, partial [Actinoplanes sp. NPDC051633]|uniref:hypothetical protein n=1 Tax=Actinoplanes sp. NPDC051633 TaxID=3155670 RepID=UPI003416E8B3
VMTGLAAVGAVVVAGLPVRQDRTAGGAGGLSLTAGARAIAGNRTLAAVVVTSTAGQLGLAAVPVVVTATAAAHQRASVAGLMMTAVAVGGLVGSLLWTARPAPVGRAPVVHMVALFASGLPLVVGVVTTDLVWVTVALAISGVFMGPLIGALFTARDALAPDGMRAQVFTLAAGLKITGAATGAAAFGLIAGAPLSAQFLLVALIPAVTGLLGLVALGRSRNSAEAQPASQRTVSG